MPYLWSFYALNKYITFNDRISEIEDILRSPISTSIYEFNETINGHEANSAYSRIELDYDIEDSQSKFIVVGKKECKVPMILAYSGNHENIGSAFVDWLKSELAVVVWPISISKDMMIKISDAVVLPGNPLYEFEDYKWFNTKFLFDVDTTGGNLRKLEVEILKDSCMKLSKNSRLPYSEAIIPYVYYQTGMKVLELPLTSISFTGYLKISEEGIIAVAFSLKNKILTTILTQSQPTQIDR